MSLKEEYLINVLNNLFVKIKHFIEPEKKIKYLFNNNPFYPFSQSNSYEFIYNYRLGSRSFVNALLACSSLLIFSFMIDNIIYCDSTIYSLFWSTAVISLMFMFFFFSKFMIFYQKRTLIIDVLKRKYSFYVGKNLVIDNDLHQIYVRLTQKLVVKNQKVFCLVLNGKGIDEIELFSYCKNEEFLRKIGKKLSLNLGINYFDILDKSKQHQILNFCQFKEYPDDMLKHLLNQTRMVISKNMFYWKKMIDELEETNSFTESENLNHSLVSDVLTVNTLGTDIFSVKSLLSSSSRVYKNSSFDEAQEAVLTFNHLKNQLDILSEQIKAIQNLKKD